MSRDEALRYLASIEETLESRLEETRRMNEAVPLIKDQLGYVRWEKAALESAPDGVIDPQIVPQLSRHATYVSEVYPLVEPTSPSRALSASAFISSGTASVMTAVTLGLSAQSDATTDWALAQAASYQTLLTASDMECRARNAVATFCRPDTLVRFDSAAATVKSACVGVVPYTNAANDMRNLLYGVKGDVGVSKKQWQKRGVELFSGNGGSSQLAEFLALGDACSRLTDDLSPSVKHRSPLNDLALETLWARTYNWCFAVITLASVSAGGASNKGFDRDSRGL